MMRGLAPRVLIADKWKTWVDLFKDLLAEDYHVVSASTLQEASSEIWKSDPPFHVVIADIQFTADPSHDLDLGRHTLLDEVHSRGTYTKPIIVISRGPTSRQIMNVVENYGLDLWYCLDKYLKDDEVFDYTRLRDRVEQAVGEAIEQEREAHQRFGYEQLQRLARENFSVLPVFDGKSNPTLCIALLPLPGISELVYSQIQNSIDILRRLYPDLKCYCVPHEIERGREQVWLAINEAGLVIADLTGRDPNVFYELGLCEALVKRVLLLVEESQDIPFHLGVFPHISYASGKFDILRLAGELRDTIEELMFREPASVRLHAHPLGETAWSLSEIDMRAALTLLHDMNGPNSTYSDDTMTAPANHDAFYHKFVKPTLVLMQCKTKEAHIQEISDSRHKAEVIWRDINQVGVVLTDIGTAHPETLYAVGLAHAQSRPVILLTPSEKAVPLDLKGLDCFEYSVDWLDWDRSTIEQKRTELIRKIGKVLDVYKTADQLPLALQSADYAPATSEPLISPPRSVWETWGWRSTDGVEIPEGVIRDILLGLNDDLPDARFCELYRDQVCRLASAREDRRIYSAVKLWEELWIHEPGLPYLPLIKKLATQEFAGEMYSEYRDHVAHSIWVYLLGIYLYKQNRPIREAVQNQFSELDFLCAWKVAALFHDIGYTGDRGIDQEEEFLQPLLDELQVFTDFPLCGYLKARGFELSEKDDTDLARISNRFAPKVLNLDGIEFMPLPGPEKRLLDLIEDLAVSTNLAQKGQKTPLQSYYSLGKMVKPKDRGRFRDHGILSALILLHQFHYLHHCLQILNGIPLPEGINRDTFYKLTKIISGPVTQRYTEIIRQAGAAMALHNVNVEIWDAEKAKQDPYRLSLHDYRITLEESPLAFLLALTDVLQCWDRPQRRYVDDPGKFSIQSQDVHISCEDDIILWSISPDIVAGRQLISPSDAIETMSKYLAYRGEKNLSLLINERELP